MKLPPKLFKPTAGNFKLLKDIFHNILIANGGLICTIYLLVILSFFIKRIPRPTDIQICLLHIPALTSIALSNLTDFAAHKFVIDACNRGHRLFVWGEYIHAIEPYRDALSIDRNNADARQGMLMCLGMLELDKQEEQRRQQSEHEYHECYEYN